MSCSLHPIAAPRGRACRARPEAACRRPHAEHRANQATRAEQRRRPGSRARAT